MIYRSADEALRRRRDELVQQRLVELEALPEAIPAVYVRRRARIMAGIAGIACAGVMALFALARRPGLTTVLQAAWPCMIGVYLFARAAARQQIRWALARTFSPTESPVADLDRLEHLTPARAVEALAARLERRSVALPMTALALLLPLSLHYGVVTLLNAGTPVVEEFDTWIRISLLCVGHSHVVLAAQCWKYAGKVGEARDGFSLTHLSDRAGWRAWAVTIGSSVVAGVVVLMVVPIAGIALVIVAPAVVAATGLAFVPIMFGRMGKAVREERLLLGY